MERFHRQLKTAIKTHQTEAWTKVLPIILLEIRAVWKEDIGSTPAEMVYEKSIRLPGQFLSDQKPREKEFEYEFLVKLRKTMEQL